VRDFPENLASIEEALKRLDTPEPSRPEVELYIHVLLASNAEVTSPAPPALKDVVTQLQSTLSFKNYQLLTTVIQRAKVTDNFGSVLTGEGSAQLAGLPGGPPVNYRYSYTAQSLSLAAAGGGGAPGAPPPPPPPPPPPRPRPRPGRRAQRRGRARGREGGRRHGRAARQGAHPRRDGEGDQVVKAIK
jgi:hypothetical protein